MFAYFRVHYIEGWKRSRRKLKIPVQNNLRGPGSESRFDL